MSAPSPSHCGARPAGRALLGLGIATIWLSVIVLLPLAAVVVRRRRRTARSGTW